MIKIKHVVYSHRDGLRWWFIDTQTQKLTYFLSLYPSDIKYLIFGGIYFLIPPFNKKHIKGKW